jgi:hypothetical protein
MSDAVVRADQQARVRAISQLWHLDRTATRQANLYCILDAARDERIHPALVRFAGTREILSLYQGTAAAELADVAPYLVCLGTDDLIFDWLWETGWGDSWGIFLWSLATPDSLRAHFRHHTKVRTDDGRFLLFRFYDPRVLQPFLETCDSAQLRDLFGPVSHYMVEDAGGQALVTLRLRNGALISERLPLQEQAEDVDRPGGFR